MRMKERYNLFFYKQKCIKVIIVDVNKRLNTYFVKIDDKGYFSIGNRTYAVTFEAVYVSRGIPAYIYYEDNPSPITKEELAYQSLPANLKKTKTRPKVSSADFYNAIEETLLSKIIRYAEGGDQKIINTTLLVGGVNLIVILGGFYFLYTILEKINLFLTENREILEIIRDVLISGVGN